ncbi:uncharacterized protein LOC126579122 isoform X2 [Anopheles aquasalis]|uniref:uncharacterized protein LOC126579122 isoform X2 n=1 Tax=Anopheles aquasalis TaxID=42839 RepID=UPI00215A8E60|nr:uncharacterized protein LOC126579122 isoform X2 [Anopheles aquasalis]
MVHRLIGGRNQIIKMWLFGFLFTIILCVARCTEGDVSVEAAFQEINSTSSDDNSSNAEEDVLYQRGASFSAKLDISDLHISMKPSDENEGEGEMETKDEVSGTGDDDIVHVSNRKTPGKGRRPPSNNPNSIAGMETARSKANHNWKTERLNPSSNAYDARSRDQWHTKQQTEGKSTRSEKSVQNDDPSVVAVSGSSRYDHQVLQQQKRPKPLGSDRRKSNISTTIAGVRKVAANDGLKDRADGRTNMPSTNDMEISGISLHMSATEQGSDVAAASHAMVDASEIRALPLSMAASVEDEASGYQDTRQQIPQELLDDKSAERNSRLTPGATAFNLHDESQENQTHSVSSDSKREQCTLDCGPEGLCSAPVEGSSIARCVCPFAKSGIRCEEELKVNTPRFSKRSWLAFPALRGAYKHVQLHIEFRPESFDGILLLTGERDDLTGDFMALLLHQGFLEFWFDCGSGMGRVKSEETIVLNQWNTITIYRHRWDAWLVLNQGNRVQGRSKGLFSRITFREPVFLGGYGNITGLDRKLPVSTGFTGCIRKFVANDHDYNFQQAPLGDVSHGFDIQECITDRCSRYPCQHGGKCLPSDDGAICLCPLGFGGDLCEMRLDLQVPSFNGSSYLRYAPLGDSCIIWFELKIIIKPLLEDGLLLYSGHHEYGDYISLCLNMGYVEFTYDLGSGPATVRSEIPLTMGQWHTIKVSRTSRLAVLKIDQLPEVMTVSPNGFWHLSLPHSLYLGGVHNVHTLPMSLRDKGAFAGCIQKIDINDRTISIISEALGGSNVENCPHACVARPCGPLAKCVPNLDTYECQCNPQNQQCNKAEELPSEVIERQQRLLKRKQQQELQSRPEQGHLPGATSVAGLGAPEDATLPHDNGPSDTGAGSSEESDETYDDYYEDSDLSSGADRLPQPEMGRETREPPSPTPSGAAADEPTRQIDVANEKIIVWIDGQKSKQQKPFSTQSNDYVDGAERMVPDPERHRSHTEQQQQQQQLDIVSAVYTGGIAVNESLDNARPHHRSQTVRDDEAGYSEEQADTMQSDGTDGENRRTASSALAGFGEKHSASQENRSPGESPETPETVVATDKNDVSASDRQQRKDESSRGEGESEDEDTDSNGGTEAYDGTGDDKDYGHQRDDRIPYRPDFLLHRPAGWNGRRSRPALESQRHPATTDPEIDETLIEEMNRIMKNRNDDADDADNYWGVASDDTEPLSSSSSSSSPSYNSFMREESDLSRDAVTVDDKEDDVREPDGSHYGVLHHTHAHHRRRNGADPSILHDSSDQDEEPTDSHRWEWFTSSRKQIKSSPQSGQRQEHPALRTVDEDDILRNMKYKNKYFRKYQGACFTGTDSYFHYSDAETMRRVISYEIDLNLRFKTHSTNGLILWTGRHSALEGDDFLSLGIENGFLHLRYNLGSGEVNIKYNATRVSDGLWHRVRALRNSQDGTLKVDGGKPITRRSPGKLRQLNTDTGLYVGGLPATAHYTRQRYRSGIMGCISELILAGELRLNFDATILGTAHNVEPGAP